MFVKLLGTVAGGGYPQWNCACQQCKKVRHKRSNQFDLVYYHACLAISFDKSHWHLLNAPPDIASQVESYKELHPGPSIRSSPIKSILLTDAELDHTIGLLVLREKSQYKLFGTKPVLKALSLSFPVTQILKSYARIETSEIEIEKSFELEPGKLEVTAFATGNKIPRYVNNSSADNNWVIGYHIKDLEKNKSIVYAPAVEQWNSNLASHLEQADCAFIDGTFWSEDEMQISCNSSKTAGMMGHIPLDGTNNTIDQLKQIKIPKTILVHINNTNPILNTASKEHKKLLDHGIEVGKTGMELEL